MKVVTRYLERNQDKVDELFYNSCKDEELPATKIFSFLQQVFSFGNISLKKDGKDFFKEDNNQNYTEKVIEQYYKTTQDGRSGKFYLYRINFEYAEILELLTYWFNTDKSFVIVDPDDDNQGTQYKPEPQEKKESKEEPETYQSQQIKISPNLNQSGILDNQFLRNEEKAMLIAAYQGQIKKMEENLLRTSQHGEDKKQMESKISQLKNKVDLLSRVNHIGSASKDSSSLSPKKPKTEGHKDKKINFKALFEFYAKQNHLTGVKASFQRIEHESQTINYQKLVHFLKEYDLFPQKTRDQKKLHNLYVRTCSNTRDLHYPEFMQFLDKVPEIVIKIPQGSSESKKDIMMAKIQLKNDKNKVLHHPFHSSQKPNFRIDQNQIKYQFKLQPINGKLQSEINIDLENRRKEKEDLKIQISKEKEEKLKKKLKRLMSIDPYNPLVLKNAHLLKERSVSVMDQPVANLDNMERFRDASFDMKAKFGIDDYEEDPLKSLATNRYSIQKRVEMLQRQQTLKMSNLMSGLIQRSQAKLAKLGLSPRKRYYK